MWASYAALVVFGWTIPDAVHRTEWAQTFSQGMAAVVPQVSNIEGISGLRYGQNQFLFSFLWVVAVPVCALRALAEPSARWRLPVWSQRPFEFLLAIGFVALLFLVAYLAVFARFELGASRVSHLLLSRFTSALAAPFFVFAPMMTALVFARYLFHLVRVNRSPPGSGM